MAVKNPHGMVILWPVHRKMFNLCSTLKMKRLEARKINVSLMRETFESSHARNKEACKLKGLQAFFFAKTRKKTTQNIFVVFLRG